MSETTLRTKMNVRVPDGMSPELAQRIEDLHEKPLTQDASLVTELVELGEAVAMRALQTLLPSSITRELTEEMTAWIGTDAFDKKIRNDMRVLSGWVKASDTATGGEWHAGSGFNSAWLPGKTENKKLTPTGHASELSAKIDDGFSW